MNSGLFSFHFAERLPWMTTKWRNINSFFQVEDAIEDTYINSVALKMLHFEGTVKGY